MSADRPHQGPIVHFASRSDAEERVHMGPALCGAGRASRTEADQYVAGDWAHVSCKACERMLQAKNRREAAELESAFDVPSEAGDESRLQPVHRFDIRGQALCGSSNTEDGDAPATHDPGEVTCEACRRLQAEAASREL